MNKEETIKQHGEAAWENHLAQARAYNKAHREQAKAAVKNWQEEHPEKVIADHQEQHRKGGKHYEKHLEYKQTGLQGEKNVIRMKHAKQYKPCKAIIAPESQLHHEWIPKTAEYRGVALVEKDQHMHGFVDVIKILDGEITLLTEEEVKNGGEII